MILFLLKSARKIGTTSRACGNDTVLNAVLWHMVGATLSEDFLVTTCITLHLFYIILHVRMCGQVY